MSRFKRFKKTWITFITLILLGFGFTQLHAVPSEVTLAWDANTEADLVGYNIYRSTTDGANFALVNTVPTGTTTYIDVVEDGTYFWVVTAFDANNESAFSNQVTATLDNPPDAPINLRIQ